MKSIVISNKCAASGGCTLLTDLLLEGPDGKPVPAGSGQISDLEAKTFQEVIDHCPVKAISLKNSGLVASSGKQGLAELKSLIASKVDSFQVPKPPSHLHRYRGSASSIPYISSEGHNRYDYRSDSQAKSAGLSHFDRVAYSQRKAVVQQALVQFKVDQLGDYIKYEQNNENFYHSTNEALIKWVTAVAEEIKEKSDGTAKVNLDANRFIIGPDYKQAKDEFYLYQLQNIEKIFADHVVRKLDSLSSYNLYINTDDMEDYRGKDMYSYNLNEAIQTFKEDVASALQDSFNYDEIIEDHVNKIYTRYSHYLKEALKEAADEMVKAIDSCLK
ncbi:ferredoxin [Paenibacillus sp. NEAU-GSW1]|uniref:ferredoxin n=1 Tax=Paenibacillus sp. NEAU-GSW1 TaxID=2682486 RepID=UPI0012E0F9F8|nr:hypothetical protein [Paenibacillus sp. NEAU-GSW1]MUT64702.1 hypothetical protein [Paenibacillus sp. NEAU-GSW1]